MIVRFISNCFIVGNNYIEHSKARRRHHYLFIFHLFFFIFIFSLTHCHKCRLCFEDEVKLEAIEKRKKCNQFLWDFIYFRVKFY